MHTDSETTDISLLGFMPYMTVVSLEMSDEPKKRRNAYIPSLWRISESNR